MIEKAHHLTRYMGHFAINLTIMAPRNAVLFNTILTQGQKVKYRNLQELEERTSCTLQLDMFWLEEKPILSTGKFSPPTGGFFLALAEG